MGRIRNTFELAKTLVGSAEKRPRIAGDTSLVVSRLRSVVDSAHIRCGRNGKHRIGRR